MEVCSKNLQLQLHNFTHCVGSPQNLFVAGSSNRGAAAFLQLDWDIGTILSRKLTTEFLVQAELAREAELAKEAEVAKQAELAKKAKQASMGALDTAADT